MSLSRKLYARCRATLLKCSEFSKYELLQAVFVVTELSAYRDGLPRATTPDGQVVQTIDYLQAQRLVGGRPVFPVFLAELGGLHQEGDALRDELIQLCAEVEQELNPNQAVDIPFVIVAMTVEEAESLLTETVFESDEVAQAEHKRFREFVGAFPQGEIEVWLSHYSKERDDWIPHTCSEGAIADIVSKVIASVNQCEEFTLPLIRPKFYSMGFFDEDEDRQEAVWCKLAESGCVLVVDAISLFHPQVRQGLRDSQMGSKEQAAMLVLSPINPCANEASQLLEQEIRHHFRRAFARFHTHLDKFCEVGVGDSRALRRWLFAILPEAAIIVQGQRFNPLNRQIIRGRMGKPLGMEQVIFGQRGGQ